MLEHIAHRLDVSVLDLLLGLIAGRPASEAVAQALDQWLSSPASPDPYRRLLTARAIWQTARTEPAAAHNDKASH